MITLVEADARLELNPYRGAATCSWTIDEKPIFWVDDESLAQPNIKFKGGNPVMFPIFSTLGLEGQSELRYDGQRIHLAQHGLARLSTEWRCNHIDENRAVLFLDSSPATRETFPFDFQLTFMYTLSATGLKLEQKVFNPGSTALPFVVGFHPYFAVSDPANCDFRGHLPGRPCFRVSNHGPDNLDDHLPHRLPLGEAEVNHHFIREMKTVTLHDRLWGRTIRLRPDDAYGAMTVWSEPGEPFVCIEPVSGRRGAFETREQLVRLAPKATWSGSIDIEVSGL